MFLLTKFSTLLAGTVGVVSLVSAISSFPARAAVLNGDFESGLTGWIALGNVNLSSSSGNTQALLTNSNALFDADGFNASGHAPLETFGSGGLEDQLGLTQGSLDLDGAFATEGSVLKQILTANAGDVLSFSWNLLSNDSQDYAFFALNGMVEKLAASLYSSTSTFSQETGFQTFNYTFTTSGTYSLGIGLVDANDFEVSSGLLVDNVSLSAGSTPVPEPSSTLGLLAFGALGAGSLLRRRQKALRERIKLT